MAETDSLLKRLVTAFSVDFATWLLGTPVHTAVPLSSELPASTVSVDQLFRVLLATGRSLMLHLEWQGRRSHAPMPWRMAEYIPRLATTYRLDLESVVLYLGRGAGRDDTGLHQVQGLGGTPTLAWRYRVIRLWELPAETLLQGGRLAPLALVGQTRITDPTATLTAVVARMRQEAVGVQRQHLMAALLALLPEEEMVTMVERLLEDDDVLAELDLPYLRRLQEQSRMKGHTEGHAEGHAEGQREGEILMLLQLLQARFGPLSESVITRVRAADIDTLLRWSTRLLVAPTIEAVFDL